MSRDRYMPDTLAAAIGRLVVRNPKYATSIAIRFARGELTAEQAQDLAYDLNRRRLEMDAALDRRYNQNDDRGYDVVAARLANARHAALGRSPHDVPDS